MTIGAVLLDFGGVMVPGPFDAFGAIETQAGVPAGAVREINSRNPDDNAWAKLERGEIDTAEFVRRFEAEAADLGHQLPGRLILDVVLDAGTGRHRAFPAMAGAVRRCRELGLPIGLITNNIRPLQEGWVLDAFDVVVQSCLCGMRKPEPAFYLHAAAELGVRLERCVMLDDLGINLKPVRELGGATIKVTDPDRAARDLFALLGT